MQQERHFKCDQCDCMTQQVRGGSSYKVPHVPHLLAIIALALVVHPIAGGCWALVYAIHAAGNLGAYSPYWTCTECGKVAK